MMMLTGRISGKYVSKQKEVTELQAKFYEDKLDKIRKQLPQVNIDPLATLRKVFARWNPAGGKPTFHLKNVTTLEVVKMVKKMKTANHLGGIALMQEL